jgi:16S rRNA (guanine527-N7)-methyltransferase
LPPPEERRAGLARTLGQHPDALPPDILDRLTVYLEHLAQWTRRINLVGASTLPEAWTRHILDSAALWPHIPPNSRRLADLGSGAGFPGLVLAILGAPDVHLVEADQRKAAFLREAARVTRTPVTVHAARLEALDPLGADVVTARALAPLPTLLPWVTRHLAPDGAALLLKGREAARELTACADQWIMRVDQRSRSEAPASDPSVSAPGHDPEGCLLILREIRRVPSAS